jgi:type I restriction enzyme S subunit
MQDLYNSGRVASYDSQSTGISNFQYEAFVNNETLELPPKGVQLSVGVALENLNRKIYVNSQISKTIEELAQTIFKSWFIDFDPVKAKIAGEKPLGMDDDTASLFPDAMVDSELGPIPLGWEASTLGKVLTLQKKSLKASPETESAPYVPIDQITSKSLFLVNSKPGVEAKTSLVSFKKGNILFGAMRPYFHKVALAPFDGTTRTTTFVLHPDNEAFLAFGLLTLFEDKSVAYATKNAQGTTIPYAVWPNSFEKMPIVKPPAPIAEAFNIQVLALLNFGYSLVAQNDTLTKMKDSLLPRLISGELQIPEEMLAS